MEVIIDEVKFYKGYRFKIGDVVIVTNLDTGKKYAYLVSKLTVKAHFATVYRYSFVYMHTAENAFTFDSLHEMNIFMTEYFNSKPHLDVKVFENEDVYLSFKR